jgi:hypothetical protein
LHFNAEHYTLLAPLKKKWETYKQAKVLMGLNINDQTAIAKVLKDVRNVIANNNCSSCILADFIMAMNMLDEYESNNDISVHIEIDQKTVIK